MTFRLKSVPAMDFDNRSGSTPPLSYSMNRKRAWARQRRIDGASVWYLSPSGAFDFIFRASSVSARWQTSLVTATRGRLSASFPNNTWTFTIRECLQGSNSSGCVPYTERRHRSWIDLVRDLLFGRRLMELP